MIRPARIEDADAIARVHVKTWQEGYRGVVAEERLAKLDVAQRADGWRAQIAGGAVHVLVAADAGADTIVGLAAVGASRDDDLRGDGELYAIYVDASRWRSGVGRALLAAAEAKLHELGFAHAALWVLEANPRARAFYEAAGWTRDEGPGGGRIVAENSAAAGLLEIRYRQSLRR